jgi:hypothetical protein
MGGTDEAFHLLEKESSECMTHSRASDINRDCELLFGDGTNRSWLQMRLSEAKSGDTKTSGSERRLCITLWHILSAPVSYRPVVNDNVLRRVYG